MDIDIVIHMTEPATAQTKHWDNWDNCYQVVISGAKTLKGQGGNFMTQNLGAYKDLPLFLLDLDITANF